MQESELVKLRSEIHEGSVCKGYDPEMWFASEATVKWSPVAREAIRICHTCPVEAQCLTYALETKEAYGIWGGKTEKERDVMRRRAQALAARRLTA